MKLFYPHAMADRVYRITPELLKSWGVRGLILDIDNTLTADRSQELPEEVAGWLEACKPIGIGHENRRKNLPIWPLFFIFGNLPNYAADTCKRATLVIE